MGKQSDKQLKILSQYHQNIDHYESAVRKIRLYKRVLAITRLTTVLAGLGTSWYFWPAFSFVISSVLLFTVLFIWLVFRDADQSAVINNYERLIRVNRHELNAMQQNLHTYEDGQSFADAGHAYASDLDLFGPSSLFQWLSRCHADQSKKLLADFLKTPLPLSAISDKQAAAKELSEKQLYCQQFQSMAMANPLSVKTEERLKEWMAIPPGHFEKPFWKWLLFIYPVFTLTILILYIADDFTAGSFLFFLTGFFAFSSFLSSKVNPDYKLLSLIQPEMDSLHEQLRLLEKDRFKTPFLQSLQNRLRPAGYDSASSAMRDFDGILKKFDFRLNIMVFIFLNIFLLWDLRQVISLNKWKRKNKYYLNDWFLVIAEMEVLISLASLVHNEPDWCFPDVDEKFFHFHAEEIGHPLIPAVNRITNDFFMEGTGIIAVITGSNMAGKSTFLRTLGINAVLALMGAPVCAQKMKMGYLKLVSSMRVADNLAENTSTFYAELKKLHYIIESVNRKEKIFVLLDEVLRGTNSADRHKGSRALVRQLLHAGAVTVMATHDTELAYSESAAGESVFNYHFDGKITDDDLYFDYKIKKGICESMNATALMKKIGILFQD